jgi:hypothetical protein
MSCPIDIDKYNKVKWYSFLKILNLNTSIFLRFNLFLKFNNK